METKTTMLFGREFFGKIKFSILFISRYNSNIFWQPAPSFTFDSLGGRQFVPRNFWEVELLLDSKGRSNTSHPPPTSAWLASLKNNYLEAFFILKTLY